MVAIVLKIILSLATLAFILLIVIPCIILISEIIQWNNGKCRKCDCIWIPLIQEPVPMYRCGCRKFTPIFDKYMKRKNK